MSDVLSVSEVGKRYATYASNFQRFATWFGADIKPESEYWANQDVTFNVPVGQALALIGQNGAGKSTLLKMITGTVRPSTGSIKLEGRVNAILELGLGFNPEFSGRQNIYHAGGLMGYSQEELTEVMPDIEAFAEIGEFFDQPTRVYSSGMQARLAFALATAKRPDVLIVDEVLSVGDAYFQHKSFDKIRQFKDQGTSIILVTHSLGDVRALCDRVILLDKGRIVKDGSPDEVVDYYNAMIAAKENILDGVEQSRRDDGWLVTRSGTFEAVISNLKLFDSISNDEVNIITVGQKVYAQAVISINQSLDRLVLGYMLRDRSGHVVWGSNTWHTKQELTSLRSGDSIVIRMYFTGNLGVGSYSLSPALVSSDTHLDRNFEWIDNALVFEVVNTDKPSFIGSSFLDAEFVIEARV
ncbi:sugar ABC transporter ATP-binding protein [Brucella anthropi]|uniref:ABC transporter ATP-binding protein n=1 Tax=Brucella anthropi TaxID=529 RepID=UPI0004463398|nr:ABC transporter ATP-binding protein [Brucella anthropi]EXL07029.1 sugar ABC transporter ATP-binding protein [Brucella anthropi]